MKRPRRRPEVHTGNSYIQKPPQDFVDCRTPGCKNIIAKWAHNGYCLPCREARHDRR